MLSKVYGEGRAPRWGADKAYQEEHFMAGIARNSG